MLHLFHGRLTHAGEDAFAITFLYWGYAFPLKCHQPRPLLTIACFTALLVPFIMIMDFIHANHSLTDKLVPLMVALPLIILLVGATGSSSWIAAGAPRVPLVCIENSPQ